MNQSPQNMPAQAGKSGPGFTKLEEATLRIIEAHLASGGDIDTSDIRQSVLLASYMLKATNHFANNGSFDNFKD